MQPYEIIMSPAELFLALEGEAFPAVDAVPTGNWSRLGKAGTRSQSVDGLVINPSQEIVEHSTAGALGPVKAVRIKEGLQIDVTIEDLTLGTLSKAMNGAGIGQIAQAAGVAGAKTMGLSQGIDVTTYSVLVRFPSPEGDGMNMQWCVPKMYNKASPSLAFKGDGTAAGIAFSWVALEDPNASSEKERFGYIVEQASPAA